jgi:hypothetical protein
VTYLPRYRLTKFAWEQLVLGTQQEARNGARDPWQCVGGRDLYQFTFEPLAGTPNIRVIKQITVGRTVMNGLSVWHVHTRGLALTGGPHPLLIALDDYISVGDHTLVREVRREVLIAPPGYNNTMRQVGDYSHYGARFQTRLAIPCKRR